MKLLLFMFFFCATFGKGIAQPCIECPPQKTFNFKLLKKDRLRIDTSIIKTNGVYILEIKDSIKNISLYYYYRFFENGRVFISCRYCSYPTEQEFNNLKHGHCGYYRVESNTKLETEYYEQPLGYQYHFYDIKQDVIQDKFYMSRNSKEIENSTSFNYVFKKMNLSSEAIW